MKVDIVMPKMGESVTEGTVIKWHKKTGEYVKKDEVLFEISTDKVDTEVPSPVEGILSEIKVNENETVDVDTVVAIVDTSSEPVKAKTESEPVKKEEKTPVVNTASQPKTETMTAPVPQNASSIRQSDENLIDIPMPKMGESVMEGTIIKWHKQVGESVKKDEILFEISTDKVDTEVPSPVDGILAEILVNEQDTVEVGTIVAKITTKAGKQAGQELRIEPEPIPTKIKKEEAASVNRENPKVKERTPVEEEDLEELEEYEEVPAENKSRFYSPLVLNIAKKEKVTFEELETIRGTGIGGRVTKNDILNYVNNRQKIGHTQPKPRPEVKPKVEMESKVETKQKFGRVSEKPGQETKPQYTASPQNYPEENYQTIPMDNIRQKIMQHMVASRDTSVHVTGIIEVDMTRINNFIKNNKEDFLKRENIKLTYMPFIAYASIKALKEHPYVNSSIDGTNIVLKKHINLGFAVALEQNGLIVPNIKDADEKNIRGLAKAINDLSDKARTKRLTPDDISKGTFTITNYGVFGTLFGTPIINQPEVAVLGVGSVTKKPVVIEIDGTDTIAIRSMMYLSLSHDHRLIDGMAGGKFLKSVKESLENFDTSNI